MRRALTFILMLSLLGGQVGMLGALLGRHQARQQMHRQIEAASETEESAPEHLALSRAERESPQSSFVRIDDGEFRYRGHLYDVVRAEWRGAVWHVWVVHDREEEQYLDALAKTMNAPMLEGETGPAQEPPVVLRPLALAPTSGAPLPAPRSRPRAFPPFAVAGPPAPYLEVLHPPPWGEFAHIS